MPVIFPEGCRGVTSGALRELQVRGRTHACGGITYEDEVEHMIARNPSVYFNKTEPAGEFMETLEKTQKQLEENADAVAAAGRHLVQVAKDTNKQMADVTGKFRDGTERLGNAIDKLLKVAARGDFAETVRLTESLVDSLERLAVLEEKGLLDKVMNAMRT